MENKGILRKYVFVYIILFVVLIIIFLTHGIPNGIIIHEEDYRADPGIRSFVCCRF